VPSASVPPIGARLRAARHRSGVTVRGLAREVGVSASLISQIETGKSSPSVSTLYAITTALGVSIEDLFGNEPVVDPGAADPHADDVADEEPAGDGDLAEPALALLAAHGMAPAGAAVGPRAGAAAVPADAARLATPAHRTLDARRDRRLGPVITPDQRETLTLDSGVTWELLGRIPHKHVDFLLITYEPGGSSSSSGGLMRHSGTEFGYVISGELTLTLGFDTHRLVAGDAVSFDSSTPHALRNDGSVPAVGVWFVLERAT
jgi:transcriptional regulator with XRE-family HTH domain/quercetin dioxygenase-like cupin family protein